MQPHVVVGPLEFFCAICAHELVVNKALAFKYVELVPKRHETVSTTAEAALCYDNSSASITIVIPVPGTYIYCTLIVFSGYRVV